MVVALVGSEVFNVRRVIARLRDAGHEVAFSQIVVEGDAEVIHKGQDLQLVFLKPVEQVLGCRLFLAPSLLRRWVGWRWIGYQALGEQFVVALIKMGQTLWR